LRIDRLIAKAISDCHFLGGVRVPARESARTYCVFVAEGFIDHN